MEARRTKFHRAKDFSMCPLARQVGGFGPQDYRWKRVYCHREALALPPLSIIATLSDTHTCTRAPS
jgi:hypothetical protein